MKKYRLIQLLSGILVFLSLSTRASNSDPMERLPHSNLQISEIEPVFDPYNYAPFQEIDNQPIFYARPPSIPEGDPQKMVPVGDCMVILLVMGMVYFLKKRIRTV